MSIIKNRKKCSVANWVRDLLVDIWTLPRDLFFEVCGLLITTKHDPSKKQRMLLGFGAIDFYRVCGKKLTIHDPPTDPSKPTNPFKYIFLREVVPETYLSDDKPQDEQKKEIMVSAILLVIAGRELYSEFVRILRQKDSSIENCYLALETLDFKSFRSTLIPFVTSHAQSLRNSNSLPDDLWTVYLEFRDLLSYFKDELIDQRVVLTTSRKTSLFLTLPRMFNAWMKKRFKGTKKSSRRSVARPTKTET